MYFCVHDSEQCVAQNKCAALVDQQCSLPVELVYQYSASKEHLSESMRMAVVVYQVHFRHETSLNVDLPDTYKNRSIRDHLGNFVVL